MPTRTVNGRLEIDVSHPWDRPGPIRQPEPHPDAIPTEDEILGILEYFFKHEPTIVHALLTEYDPDIILQEGRSRLIRDRNNANI